MSPPTIRDAVAPMIVGIAAGATDFLFAYLELNPWLRALACGAVAGLVGFALIRRKT